MFCYEHPKRDQTPKFTPISETTGIPAPFIWDPPPPPAFTSEYKHQALSSYRAPEPEAGKIEGHVNFVAAKNG